MALSKCMVSAMILLLAIIAFCITPGFSLDDGVISQDPTTPSFQKPPGDSPGFYNYLLKCSQKFIRNCGYLTFSTIVHRNATLAEECCCNIVNDVGKKCYDNLIIPVLETPAFRANVSKIIKSNKQVWDRCVSIAIHCLPF